MTTAGGCGGQANRMLWGRMYEKQGFGWADAIDREFCAAREDLADAEFEEPTGAILEAAVSRPVGCIWDRVA